MNSANSPIAIARGFVPHIRKPRSTTLDNARAAKAKQKMLFNNHGDTYFDFQRDAVILASELVKVGQITLEVPSSLGDIAHGTKVLLRTLEEFQKHKRSWKYEMSGVIQPITFETWDVPRCTLSSRKSREDEVVRAEYFETTKSLTLLLPSSTTWRKNGLLWLASYETCCQRSRENPMKWRGNLCSCVVEYF
ncbi:hypothetical protein GCN74_26780 [Janthinobacterium sp. FT14W]|uniref:hypothetical protein n=1 Tax=Janthinobacterium sp. FT14W TaxID=2654253 RepID=UPI0012655020|nr:hypothetical protein [Janthinobacterium sp. FT14W]KAB8050754.1 hypothetical protein GCN74_26780 [Janthinobacterium sp. FT14W]